MALGSYQSHNFHAFLLLGDMGSQGPKGKYRMDIFTFIISEGWWFKAISMGRKTHIPVRKVTDSPRTAALRGGGGVQSQWPSQDRAAFPDPLTGAYALQCAWEWPEDCWPHSRSLIRCGWGEQPSVCSQGCSQCWGPPLQRTRPPSVPRSILLLKRAQCRNGVPPLSGLPPLPTTCDSLPTLPTHPGSLPLPSQPAVHTSQP